MQEQQLSQALTMADVERLAADPSAQNREVIAAKLVARYDHGWSTQERDIADQLLRTLARDFEVAVRQALSRSVAMSMRVPRDVAVTLAHDIADVAQPILTDSMLLDVEDLLDVIARHGAAHQMAIAARRHVRAPVSEALVARDDPRVIARLVANDGAEIAEPVLHKVVERHGADERVNAPLSERDQLPLSVAESLVAKVSEKLRERLLREGRQKALPALDDSKAAAHAALLLVDPSSDALDVLALVERLHRSHQLSATMLMRALEQGDRIMASAIVARLSGMAMPAVHGRLFHGNQAEQMALLTRAGLKGENALELTRLISRL